MDRTHSDAPAQFGLTPETHLKIFPAKGPIAEHLKEGMMGQVSAHILQVAVAASGPHTLLTVGHTSEACHLASGIHGAQEDWLELGVRERVGEYFRVSKNGWRGHGERMLGLGWLFRCEAACVSQCGDHRGKLGHMSMCV